MFSVKLIFDEMSEANILKALLHSIPKAIRLN